MEISFSVQRYRQLARTQLGTLIRASLARLSICPEATVSRPALVTNTCLSPGRSAKAIKVQEAWWSNFTGAGKWSLGSGDVNSDGLPTGTGVAYGRTVWHAQGQLPYYLTGSADGKTVDWCANEVTAGALPGGPR